MILPFYFHKLYRFAEQFQRRIKLNALAGGDIGIGRAVQQKQQGLLRLLETM